MSTVSPGRLPADHDAPDSKPINHGRLTVREIPAERTAMKAAPPKTEPAPSARFRKAVFGGGPRLYFSLRRAATVFILATLTARTQTLAAPAPSSEARPNILLILVDDLGYQDLSCQGSPDIRTPHIDALARSGLRCTASYVTAPQCAPSRAGLLTGMNQARFGFLNNNSSRGIPPASIAPSVADMLKRAGYATAMIGKWHVELPEYYKKVGPADRPAAGQPQSHGFDSFVMIDGGLSHYFPYSPGGSKYMRERGYDPRLYEGRPGGHPHFINDLPPDTYLTDYFSTRAVDHITKNRDRPWFLYLAYNAPHDPLMASEKDLDANAHIPDPRRRKFAGAMTALDRGIGRILDALESGGQRRRTLVFFISDNGGPTDKTTSRNDPLRGMKGDVFEGGIRVPFICSWPGVLPEGRTFSDPVSTLDLLPTFATLAGQPIPANSEGTNILPSLKGETAALAGRTLCWHWNDNHLAIRSGRFKETRNGAKQGGFYDVIGNISENDERQIKDPAVRKSLSETLDRWNAQLNREAAENGASPEKDRVKLITTPIPLKPED